MQLHRLRGREECAEDKYDVFTPRNWTADESDGRSLVPFDDYFCAVLFKQDVCYSASVTRIRRLRPRRLNEIIPRPSSPRLSIQFYIRVVHVVHVSIKFHFVNFIDFSPVSFSDKFISRFPLAIKVCRTARAEEFRLDGIVKALERAVIFSCNEYLSRFSPGYLFGDAVAHGPVLCILTFRRAKSRDNAAARAGTMRSRARICLGDLRYETSDRNVP